MVCGCTGTSAQTDADINSNDQTEMVTITDSNGREVTIPSNPQRVVCSGSGCLRLLSYLGGNELAVGVDNIDKKDNSYDKETYNARAYYLAYPEYADLPLIGNHHSDDDPESIIACEPEIIFRTDGYRAAINDDELQEKTGIPVVGLNYGDPTDNRQAMYDSLRLMGQIIGREDRADEVAEFFESQIGDLGERTTDADPAITPKVYIAGISNKGPQGLLSTSLTYAPFTYINADRFNVADSDENTMTQAFIAKEKLIDLNPDTIFIELGTVQLNPSAIDELKDDSCYRSLDAVKTGDVYGMLPYNWYSYNYGTAIISAYYAGKMIYPDQFEDIEIKEKADEIYEFLFEMPEYDILNERFDGIGYTKISL
ncbi:iron ABC transporter substrate-binding protein [Methanoplanus endosymbiosus]|uniref:Iron ABC transporter substrate-binding protein n=1 Tax=Methanoplanus endosymbiosus TaxID=33865 RepID=A0A9E7PMZ5_9EURY|nr:iron ABC transporter substrate-binding protein [Methanoplanus endosymbiosus]UUX93245.1 iron ABC transporter substrate-binding protein [Methanoplanus endosymbiosus]